MDDDVAADIVARRMADGAIHAVVVDDAIELILYPMLFGNTRLCVSDYPGAPTIARAWCYQAHAFSDAIHAVTLWDGEGLPPGRWHKDVFTGETRPEHLAKPVDG